MSSGFYTDSGIVSLAWVWLVFAGFVIYGLAARLGLLGLPYMVGGLNILGGPPARGLTGAGPLLAGGGCLTTGGA